MTNFNFDSSASFSSPIGAISLYALDHHVVHLRIGGEVAVATGKGKVLAEAEKQLKAYLAGKSSKLDFAVRLEGTEFQKSVWAEIAKVDFGQSVSYAQIAKAIGKPLGSRAVGGAVGKNPLPLIVGCHRVLGASGKITGYSGGEGLATKRLLLELEGLSAKE